MPTATKVARMLVHLNSWPPREPCEAAGSNSPPRNSRCRRQFNFQVHGRAGEAAGHGGKQRKKNEPLLT